MGFVKKRFPEYGNYKGKRTMMEDKMNRREFNEKLLKSLLYGVLIVMGLTAFPKKAKGDFKANCPRDYYCIKKCPFEAIGIDAEGFPLINNEKCVAWVEETKSYKWRKCGICLKGCPTRALELYGKS